MGSICIQIIITLVFTIVVYDIIKPALKTAATIMIVFVYETLTYNSGIMEKFRKQMKTMLSNAKLKKIIVLSFKCITSEIVAFYTT